MNHIKQDEIGLFYEEEQVELFNNNQADFYTTVFINRAKSKLSGKVQNAQMNEIDGYNLNNITCIKQLIDNDYPFQESEIKKIEAYLRSLQDTDNHYLIDISGANEKTHEEHKLYFTYEAIKIAEKLDISLLGVEEILNVIDTKTLEGKSIKETMAILGIRELLQMEQYSESDIQQAYTQLFQSWYASDSNQISWYFDLYYLSFISEIGQVQKKELSTLQDDMINLIRNPYINLTMKSMAMDILGNYQLMNKKVRDAIEVVVKKADELYYLGDNQYAYPTIYQGDIATTYYVYLCNILDDKDQYNTGALQHTISKDISDRQFEAYGPQELSQLLYLGNRFECIFEEDKDEIIEFLNQEIYKASLLSEVYFIVQSMEWVKGQSIKLDEKQLGVINDLIQHTFSSENTKRDEIYDKMVNVFFYVSLKDLLTRNKEELVRVEYDSILVECETFLDKDIRLLYFYYNVNQMNDSEFAITEQLLKNYERRGLYFINQQVQNKSVYIQFLGKRMKQIHKNRVVNVPKI